MAEPTLFATGGVLCPECGLELPVGIMATLTTDDDGNQVISVEPDTADVWAHAWTHTP